MVVVLAVEAVVVGVNGGGDGSDVMDETPAESLSAFLS